MTQINPALVGECATWLSIVSQLFNARMGTLLEPYDLTQAQFSILHHLAQPKHASGTRISDIATAVEVGQPAVTKTIAKFQKLGLVEVKDHPTDKRAKIVVPRPDASQLVMEIRQSMGAELTRTFAAIDGENLETFAASLKQLGGWLDQNRL